MAELLATLKDQADMVLIDVPQVVAVTDASVLASQVDGITLVLDSGTVRLEMAQRAKELLTNANGRILNEHTWLVRGYLSFKDAIASELIFDDLVERMRDAVRVDGSLGLPGLLGSGLSEERGVQVASAGPVLFAGLLCHSAALELKTRNWAEWRKP